MRLSFGLGLVLACVGITALSGEAQAFGRRARKHAQCYVVTDACGQPAVLLPGGRPGEFLLARPAANLVVPPGKALYVTVRWTTDHLNWEMDISVFQGIDGAGPRPTYFHNMHPSDHPVGPSGGYIWNSPVNTGNTNLSYSVVGSNKDGNGAWYPWNDATPKPKAVTGTSWDGQFFMKNYPTWLIAEVNVLVK